METVQNGDQLRAVIQQHEAVMVYFSHTSCQVCQVLKPKVQELIEEVYQRIKCVYVDTELHPDIPAQQRIFAVPTILVFFGGKEYYRWSRNISIQQMRKELSRPYNMLFD